MRKFRGLTREQDRKICKLVEEQMKDFLKMLDKQNLDIGAFADLFLEFNTRTGKFCRSFEIIGSESRIYLEEDLKGYDTNKISDEDLEAVVVINISQLVEESQFCKLYYQHYDSFQIMIKNFDKITIGFRDNINLVYNQIIKSNKKAFNGKRSEKSKVA